MALIEKIFNPISTFHHKRISRYLNELDIEKIIDIGAHKGEFLENMLKIEKVNSFYAFEPQKNIFNELHRDLQLPIPAHGCLQSWAQQGVLLLNAVLTVEQQQAGSHAGKGWELFTDAIVARLSDSRSGLVFMLWGAYAQKKGRLINQEKHCVLSSAHPSPLSAHRGFLGNQHFSKANHYLTANHETAIRWSLD